MSTAMFEAPGLLNADRREESGAEWAIAAAVAAIVGIAVAIVLYICSVCQARSFNGCMIAIRKYWTTGC